MKIIKCNTIEDVGIAANEIMSEMLQSKPNCVLGLATGSTPIPLYREMIKDFDSGKTDYKGVVTFNLDEYVNIPTDHPESYNSFMFQNLFNHVNINEDNIHMPNGITQEECDEYDKSVMDCGIDLQVLGIGSNGHIGFNEPGTDFSSTTRIVDLAASTIEANSRFFNNDTSLVPKQAMSMGIATIMNSKKIVLIATGRSKRDAVNAMLNGPIDAVCPASILQKHSNVIVIVDQEAGENINK